MLQFEILVGKRLGTVDTGTPRTIAIEKVPSLDHEILDLIICQHQFSQVMYEPKRPATWSAKKKRKKKQPKNRSESRLTNDSMEFAPFIPLRISLTVFGLASAILAEILGGFRRDICKEFHFHSAQRLS